MPLAYAHALDVLRRGVDLDLHEMLMAALEPLDGHDPVVYLVDFAHLELMPLPVSVAGPIPVEEAVTGTLAGRAFVSGQPVTAQRGDEVRAWVPLIEGTERTGVLAVTVPSADADVLRELASLGVFAGLAVATVAGVSDIPHLRRRGRMMSLAATMQWELMPPLSSGNERVAIAGVLEPAYDIAGDGFDYAINGDETHFALVDGMGHGVGSSLLASLAIGAYRHARRQHDPIATMHQSIEDAVAEHGGEAFATGILAQLSTTTGVLEWSCAGHPAPLLLRDRKIVAELTCEPSLPFGLGDRTPMVSRQPLQPNDAVLLYTDGVIEARTPAGEEFGLERLRDLVEREAASGRRPDELLRRIVRAVLDHQVGAALRDDATLLLVQWLAADATSEPSVPGQRLISAGH
jgi:serine/threonine protein phosphatase PrpC